MGAGFFDAATHFDAAPEALHDLIDAGLDLARTDRDGKTLLHLACAQGHLAAVVLLAQNGVPLEAQDSDGRTPLHLACLMAGREGARGSEHAQVVAFLQEQGAATGTQDVYGHTPLSYLPQALKSVGRATAFVDGREPSWVVSVVDEKSAVRQGAVAQVVATMTR